MIDSGSSIEQYLELFRNHRGLIDSGAAPALNSLRDAAYDALTRTGLPAYGSENYSHTDLEKVLAPDFGLNLANVPIDMDPAVSFRCDVPNLSSSLFLVLNDSCRLTDTSLKSLPEGVLAGSLREIALTHPEIVTKFYGSAADMSNPLTALNTMLLQDGFILYVPRGVKVEKPLQLVSIFNSGMPLMAVRRILVVLEEDAEATLLTCDHTQRQDTDFLSLQTVELILGENASLGYYDMEESSDRTTRLNSLYSTQAEGSRLLTDAVTLFNGETRNEYFCNLEGRHCHLELLGLAIEDRRRKLVTHSLISHSAPDCHSEELFKYVADDESKAVFSGRILVHPGASGTEAYQSNRNIAGSDDAIIYSKPQLEIYNDDVKCSHGSATGKLDEQQIFYMRARGIDLEDARRMLKQAFMADVINKVRLESLRSRLHLLVEQRFSGRQISCRECGADCFSSK